jgi:hypothetical protein
LSVFSPKTKQEQLQTCGRGLYFQRLHNPGPSKQRTMIRAKCGREEMLLLYGEST